MVNFQATNRERQEITGKGQKLPQICPQSSRSFVQMMPDPGWNICHRLTTFYEASQGSSPTETAPPLDSVALILFWCLLSKVMSANLALDRELGEAKRFSRRTKNCAFYRLRKPKRFLASLRLVTTRSVIWKTKNDIGSWRVDSVRSHRALRRPPAF